ncbi:TPA: hypothetical protein MX502_005444, partial [Klebsiella pneumoniae]|nr:hypothetical protein [Klebsiella pneumoniae]HCA8108085.1 hypothetical protein [Klebsiella pneumoniae]
MKLKGYVTALPVLLLTGCAVLPGQPTDYGRFCNVSGIASHGETYGTVAKLAMRQPFV